MKNKFRNIIIVIATVFISACCSKESLVGVDYGNFIFLNKITNDNLFFGANKTLNKDSVFIKYDNDTFYNKIQSSSNLEDSVIYIEFKNKETCFILFSNSDIDTFKLRYEKITGKSASGNCKITATTIKNIKYNGVELNINNIQQPIKIYK